MCIDTTAPLPDGVAQGIRTHVTDCGGSEEATWKIIVHSNALFSTCFKCNCEQDRIRFALFDGCFC